ncbi:hypothetical protein CISG_08115 [Coccidioides immitis RMSCC 3703]|uniref:Uncharacterized protein n=1 Tax=Coccidioides immitis RMSCC 3703 TaxID=454286 RepID=A0A0J8R684_COCIT|nr:hypothetical protein CISG_08115 [Coccidioides immitis RMSCC 3703]
MQSPTGNPKGGSPPVDQSQMSRTTSMNTTSPRGRHFTSTLTSRPAMARYDRRGRDLLPPQIPSSR